MDIRNTTRGTLPRIPFERLAQSALGSRYELSLVICGDALARGMNREHRGKIYAPNVLSFPLSRTEGEIFINIRAAEREAKKYAVSVSERLALLYVHGLFHLAGMRHSASMDSKERTLLKKFGFAR
ncbi:MAG TPA: rRNA maturation RNase YbeY [Candidatus Paceibacterota bacterium]